MKDTTKLLSLGTNELTIEVLIREVKITTLHASHPNDLTRSQDLCMTNLVINLIMQVTKTPNHHLQ